MCFQRRSGQDKRTALIGAPIEQDTVVREEGKRKRNRKSRHRGCCIQRIELSQDYYELSKDEEKCGCTRGFVYENEISIQLELSCFHDIKPTR